MFGRDIQGDEVVPLVLDLGAVGDAEAHPAEDVQQLVDRLHDHVTVADLHRDAGQRDIDQLTLLLLRLFEGLFPLLEGRQ